LNVAAACESRSPRPISRGRCFGPSLVIAPLPTDPVYFGEISLSGASAGGANLGPPHRNGKTRITPRRAARIGAR